jgi:hypothetical protein
MHQEIWSNLEFKILLCHEKILYRWVQSDTMFDVVQGPLTTGVFSAVLIKIHSNWGSKYFSDIYRIRIPGVPLG